MFRTSKSSTIGDKDVLLLLWVFYLWSQKKKAFTCILQLSLETWISNLDLFSNTSRIMNRVLSWNYQLIYEQNLGAPNCKMLYFSFEKMHLCTIRSALHFFYLFHYRVRRSMGPFLIWRHKLSCISLSLCRNAWNVVRDVKSGMNPCSFWLCQISPNRMPEIAFLSF